MIHRITSLKLAETTRRVLLAMLVVGFLAVIIAHTGGTSRAASGSGTLYMSPASGTYTVGSTVTLTIEENSGSTQVNGVEADLTYPASQLQYESYSVAASGFNYPGPAPSTGSGSFKYAILSTTELTNNQTVLSVTFQVIAPGTATVSFANSAAVAEPSGASENPVESGTSLTLNAASSGTGTTTTPPPPSNQTNPPHSVAPTPAPATTTSTSSGTAVEPSGSSASVSVPNQAALQVSTPATVSPVATSTASDANPVVAVDYYLNKKLLASVTRSPYKYTLNTRHILNGTYTFKTVTHYVSGTTSTTQQKLIIKNPESLTQIGLAAQHYAVPFSTIILIVAIIVVLFYGRLRFATLWQHAHLATATVEAPVVVPPNAASTTAPLESASVVTPTPQVIGTTVAAKPNVSPTEELRQVLSEFRYYLKPSQLSGFIALVVPILGMIIAYVVTHYQGASLNQESSAINSFFTSDGASSEYHSILSRAAQVPVLNELPLYLFWIGVGIIAYLFVIKVAGSFKRAVDFEHELSYVNSQRNALIKQALIRSVVRLVVLLVWVGFLLFSLHRLLPSAILAVHNLASQFSLNSLMSALLFTALLVVDLMLQTVFLRLMALRPRLWGLLNQKT